ncbi:hypothetical protein RHGRI_014092 [Rhododendron griersonianum]|uniref:Uncharacterized protein n=1 Tax=Rhododendron griersonianum TaxID=479676 RepID=A0AAV6K8G8_9ERIC|nr:hypothetical protein RHGRI_014092 [Rhododendron griersonianum]
MLPEVVEKSIQSSVDDSMTSQDASVSPKDKETIESVSPMNKETTEMGSKDLNPPVPFMLEIAKDKDALQKQSLPPILIPIKLLSLNPSFRLRLQRSRASTNYRSSTYCQPRGQP